MLNYLLMAKEAAEYEQLMYIPDEVLTKTESLHTPSNDFDIGVPIYRKEIHTLQAIGQHRQPLYPQNMAGRGSFQDGSGGESRFRCYQTRVAVLGRFTAFMMPTPAWISEVAS